MENFSLQVKLHFSGFHFCNVWSCLRHTAEARANRRHHSWQSIQPSFPLRITISYWTRSRSKKLQLLLQETYQMRTTENSSRIIKQNNGVYCLQTDRPFPYCFLRNYVNKHLVEKWLLQQLEKELAPVFLCIVPYGIVC